MSKTIWWKGFCGNESLYDAFWSEELTINTFNPDLTNCFQDTVLVWVPSLFLLLGSSIYIPYVRRHEPETSGRGFSKIGKAQLFGLIALILVSLCDLVFLLVKDASGPIQPVAYTATVILLLTYMWAVVVHTISCRRGFYNTGVAFVYWFSSLIAAIVVFRSKILQIQVLEVFLFVTTVLRFTLIVLQFISTFIPDKGKQPHYDVTGERTQLLKLQSGKDTSHHSDEEQKLINPMLSCTFPSQIVLFWFSSLVKKGYKQPINLSDIWKLSKHHKSLEIFKIFNKYWLTEVSHKDIRDSQRLTPDPEVESSSSSGSSEESLDTSASSHSQGSTNRDTKTADSGGGYMLFKALFRTFAVEYMSAGLLVLFYFGCLLLNPILLNAVIDFVDSNDPYTWKGFALAAALFFFGILNPILFHNHLFISFTVGMRIRGAVTAAIYRKALRLSAVAKRKTTTGEIVNLMSIDVQKLQDAVAFLHYGWATPCLVGVSMYFLWQQLGPSCLVGLVYLFGILPASSQYVTRKVISIQRENMTLKDERIKVMNQVLTGIKVLKLYAWEPFFETRLQDVRKKETDNLRKFWLVVAIANILLICTPFIVAVLCFSTFVLSDPSNVLTPQVAFVSISYLNLMSLPINVVPFILMNCAQGVISLKRIGSFLLEAEVSDDNVTNDPNSEFAISVEDATFSWGEKKRSLLSGINFSMRPGSLVAVVGEVGSGKSSVLAALLGDMVKLQGSVNVVGRKAYVPQQAWIQNLTVKDNILFGEPLNEERYKEILELCALGRDLEVLPGGDMTEIGERGINLSGGQKQRVSIARAVYQSADIYLLDDPLSAVDAHVGKHIFDKVVGPQGCLQNKTRVFVTNQIQYLKHTDDVIVMVDGKISERGSYEQLLHHDGAFAQFIRTHLKDQNKESADEEVKQEMRVLERTLSTLSTHSDDVKSDVKSEETPISLTSHQKSALKRRRSRKMTQRSDAVSTTVGDDKLKTKRKEALLVEETMEQGAIHLGVLKWYIKASSYMSLFITVIGLLCFVAAQAYTNIWLSAWSNDASASVNDTMMSQDVRLGVYGGLGVAQVAFTAIFNIALTIGCVRAARILHDKLLKNVLKCPMSFFDTTPLGRIINRFSKDVDIMDKNLIEFICDSLLFGAPLMSTFVVIIYSVPIFTAVFIPLVIVFIIFQRVYTNCARQIKRIDSVTRSPIYNFFSETLNGVTSIRAYGCENRFTDNNDKLLDKSQSVWLSVFTSNRWLGISGEFIADFVVLFTVIFATLQRETLSAGLAGLAVTYSLQVSIDLTLLLRTTCELETYIVAVERIKEYAEQQTEAAWRIAGIAPSVMWPENGIVTFRNYSTRYRNGLDLVLNNVSFTIKAQEKVGIVGRTGAGKSSLALALFRLLEASGGGIVIDDLPIAEYGLHDVRSRLTIIPQDPVLFSGSMRFNLDPAGKHTDEDLWGSLEHAHLKPFVSSLPQQLEYECGEDGENLSVGQRQLVCLARALLRKTKVLVLDEATASVDVETDSLIQTTIKKQFGQCTIITVAHRLNTILDYDRIMVLESGQVAEFDTPAQLLSDPTSQFYSMAKDAGLV